MACFILQEMGQKKFQKRLCKLILDGKVKREITMLKNSLIRFGHILMFSMKALLILKKEKACLDKYWVRLKLIINCRSNWKTIFLIRIRCFSIGQIRLNNHGQLRQKVHLLKVKLVELILSKIMWLCTMIEWCLLTLLRVQMIF